MSSHNNNNNKKTKEDSYLAFSAVDQLVSKPVLGSDGAASWQAFQKEDHLYYNKTTKSKLSVAPTLPRKRNDIVSREEELDNERLGRLQSGHAVMGSGYTTFRQKSNNTSEEKEQAKRAKLIAQRIRPDDQEYFIPSSTFIGWKHDYIFTTRQGRGTGYYWDGMDSLKQQQQQQPNNNTTTTTTTTNNNNVEETKPKKKKQKKIKDIPTQSQSTISDIISPMEQVANAIRKRNSNDTTLQSSLPNGWNEAVDPSTQKVYYYQPLTGNRQWEKPSSHQIVETNGSSSSSNKTKELVDTQSIELAALTGKKLPVLRDKSNAAPSNNDWEKATDPTTQKVYYYQRSTGKRQWDNPNHQSTVLLPNGWKSIVDPTSGKTYYYHEQTQKTSWEIPTS